MRLWGPALGLAALAAAFTGFIKHQDQDNKFCISCHLHGEFYRRTVAPELHTLSAAHYQARHPGRPERCFTCHSGEGVKGWTAVTALSAVDAARWVLGDRKESTSMRLPLENEACLKCHAKDIKPTAATYDEEGGRTDNRYHQISDHLGRKPACVACHTTHTDGSKANKFLDNRVVQAQCSGCHKSGMPGGF